MKRFSFKAYMYRVGYLNPGLNSDRPYFVCTIIVTIHYIHDSINHTQDMSRYVS